MIRKNSLMQSGGGYITPHRSPQRGDRTAHKHSEKKFSTALDETRQILTNSQHQWIQPTDLDQNDFKNELQFPQTQTKTPINPDKFNKYECMKDMKNIYTDIHDKIDEIQAIFTSETQKHKRALLKQFKEKLHEIACQKQPEGDAEVEVEAAYWIKKYKAIKKNITSAYLEVERLHTLNEAIASELERKAKDIEEINEERSSLEKQFNETRFENSQLLESLQQQQQNCSEVQKKTIQYRQRSYSPLFSQTIHSIQSESNISPSSHQNDSYSVPSRQQRTIQRHIQLMQNGQLQQQQQNNQRSLSEQLQYYQKELAKQRSRFTAIRQQHVDSDSERRSLMELMRLCVNDIHFESEDNRVGQNDTKLSSSGSQSLLKLESRQQYLSDIQYQQEQNELEYSTSELPLITDNNNIDSVIPMNLEILMRRRKEVIQKKEEDKQKHRGEETQSIISGIRSNNNATNPLATFYARSTNLYRISQKDG
ncbi:MAG: hypothetical protein EZS28_043661, partial [Streblomastix strix]